jgi:hypothetical protein
VGSHTLDLAQVKHHSWPHPQRARKRQRRADPASTERRVWGWMCTSESETCLTFTSVYVCVWWCRCHIAQWATLIPLQEREHKEVRVSRAFIHLAPRVESCPRPHPLPLALSPRQSSTVWFSGTLESGTFPSLKSESDEEIAALGDGCGWGGGATVDGVREWW